jgi:hypothetical protein
MLERTQSNSSLFELDKAFQYVVTLAWEDLMTPIEPRAMRVEYLWEPGSPLDHLSVWSVRAGGYQDLVCDFRASASLTDPASGACFGNGRSSDKLAATLDFIMKNQGQFTRPADAGRHGLVLIHAPDADDRRQAATWMKAVRALQGAQDVEQAVVPPEDHRHDEEASSRMDEEGCSKERDAALPDATGYGGCGPYEAPARTNAADYFEQRYAWPE